MQNVKESLRLPTELTEEVFALLELHHDTPSIATWALVCRSWVSQSRRILFADITLDPRNWERFMEIMRHPLTSINPIYIGSLTVNTFGTHPNGGGDLSHRIKHGGLPALINIKKKSLSACFFRTREELFNVLAPFSHVEELVFHRLTFKASKWDHYQPPTFPKLRTMTITARGKMDYLNGWILGVRTTPNLTTLIMRRFRGPHTTYMDTQLASIGGSLEHLEVDRYSIKQGMLATMQFHLKITLPSTRLHFRPVCAPQTPLNMHMSDSRRHLFS